MRSFDLGATVMDERFEGYASTDELAESWTASGGTLALCDDPVSSQGEGRHVAVTFSGAESSWSLQTVHHSQLGVDLRDGTTQVAFNFLIRYRADAALDGTTVGLTYAHSAFGTTATTAAICDDQWHTLSVAGTDFQESSLGAGAVFTLADVPGAGVFRFGRFWVQRTSPLAAIADTTGAVIASRCDWADGIDETYQYRTEIITGDDGTEWREALRVTPTVRVTFTTLEVDGDRSARTDAVLYKNHGLLLQVPRWQHALVFDGLTESNTVVHVQGNTTDGLFEPGLNVMLYDLPASYETFTVNQIGTGTLRSLVEGVDGSWTVGKTLVVPLTPGYLVPELTMERPTKRGGGIRLTFDLVGVA